MKKIYNLFIPELVPLENKGEEAIVRGIADVLFPEGNCNIHLLDEVHDYSYTDRIHVYPVSWFISPWLNREFGLGLSYEKMRDSAYSVLRNLLHKFYPTWVNKKCSSLKKADRIFEKLKRGESPVNEKEVRLKQLLDCDFVVAGHDGALDERVCQLIEVMLKHGKEFGVFGVEFPLKFKSQSIVQEMQKILEQSKFFYCRTEASLNVVKENFTNISADLSPDPAFGMIPNSENLVERLVGEHDLDMLFQKPVVMCTSCEPPPISRFSFEDVKNPEAKLIAHRDLYAKLLKHIVDHYDVNIMFLPHAIGPGKALDDRVVAQDILDRAGLPRDRVILLNKSLSAKELKGLIGRAELMVAERIHSMIGATGVATPFLCLGSKKDRRIDGIIVDMLDLQDNIYYLNNPELNKLLEKFDAVWSQRDKIKRHMRKVYKGLSDELSSNAQVMRGFFP